MLYLLCVGSEVSTLHVLFHLILTETLWSSYYDHSWMDDEKTESGGNWLSTITQLAAMSLESTFICLQTFFKFC